MSQLAQIESDLDAACGRLDTLLYQLRSGECSQDDFDDLEEEASEIARSIRGAFRGRAGR